MQHLTPEDLDELIRLEREASRQGSTHSTWLLFRDRIVTAAPSLLAEVTAAHETITALRKENERLKSPKCNCGQYFSVVQECPVHDKE